MCARGAIKVEERKEEERLALAEKTGSIKDSVAATAQIRAERIQEESKEEKKIHFTGSCAGDAR